MKPLPFVAATLLLAACGTGEGWVPANDKMAVDAEPDSRPASAPPPPAIHPSPPPVADTGIPASALNEHCDAVARQRASDARANGYSFKMEDIIYQGTYKDCVAWDSRHSH